MPTSNAITKARVLPPVSEESQTCYRIQAADKGLAIWFTGVGSWLHADRLQWGVKYDCGCLGGGR